MRMGYKVILKVIAFVFLIFLAFFFLFPIAMGIINSLKTEAEMFRNVLALPIPPRWGNYEYIIYEVNIFRHFLNNVIVSVVAVTGITICSSLAGYKLSRTPGKLSKIIFFMMMSSMLIPFHSIMFPLIRVTQVLGIQDFLITLPLIYVGLGVNFAIFLYHSFTKNVPREIEEAALIDGCNQFQSFYKVVFPLMLPITSTLIILNVLWTWNDFLLPLVIINRYQNYTLVLMASLYFSTFRIDWSYILAILTLTSMPMIIFYLVFQKYIIKGISEGAIKG